MGINRDLAKEKEALKTFGAAQNRMPSSAEDWKILHQYAYGANMPDEFKDVQSAGASATGLPTTASPITAENPRPDISSLAGSVDQASQNYQQFTSPTQALNLLQEAVREKTGVAQAGIGESEIFKKAGISGYAPLAQSLNTRGDELAINQAAFTNIINGMAGNYRDMANAAKFKYDEAMTAYNSKRDELLEAEKNAREHAEAIEMIGIENNAKQVYDKWYLENITDKGLDSGNLELDEKQLKQIESTAESKKLLALKDLKNKLTAYRAEAAKPEGFDISGSRKSILDSMYADLKISYKEAANLGALTGPDMEIIAEAIKPIAGIQNLVGYLSGGRQQGVLDSIDTAMSSVNSQAKVSYDSLKSKWGDYENDPYLQNLREGFELEEAKFTSLDDYVIKNPTQVDSIEKMRKENPAWGEDDILQILQGGGFNSAPGTAEKGLTSVKVGNKSITVSPTISNRLASADRDYFNATGKHIQVTQSYRTKKQQAELYRKSQAGEIGRAAPPGTSFHEKGLAIDVGENWKAYQPYLRKYGLINALEDDRGHFSYGEFKTTS